MRRGAGIVLVGLAWAAGSVAPPGLGAQEAPRVEPGRTVRVTTPAVVHHTVEGTVVDRSSRSLTLRPGGDGPPVELDLDHVRRLQVATGTHRGIGRGAFTGLWSGLVLSLIIFEIDEADDEIDPECGRLQCYEAPFFVGMSLGGAAVGAAVGALFRVTEWTDVPVEGLAVTGGLAPRRERGGDATHVALELRFELSF